MAVRDANEIWRCDFSHGPQDLGTPYVSKPNLGDGFYNAQVKDPPRQGRLVTVVEGQPVPGGGAALRTEITYGDIYTAPGHTTPYSDERACWTCPSQATQHLGDTAWYGVWVFFPTDYVGSDPKWDQPPESRAAWDARKPSDPHLEVSWWTNHHAMIGGGQESGSAPIYFRTNDRFLKAIIVDPSDNAKSEQIELAPIRRGAWQLLFWCVGYDTDPAKGFIEVIVDGAVVLPKHYCSTMYAGTNMYPVLGPYGHKSLQDPGLKFGDGELLFPVPHPKVVFFGPYAMGRTLESVLQALPPPGVQVVVPPAPPVISARELALVKMLTAQAEEMRVAIAAHTGHASDLLQTLGVYASTLSASLLDERTDLQRMLDATNAALKP